MIQTTSDLKVSKQKKRTSRQNVREKRSTFSRKKLNLVGSVTELFKILKNVFYIPRRKVDMIKNDIADYQWYVDCQTNKLVLLPFLKRCVFHIVISIFRLNIISKSILYRLKEMIEMIQVDIPDNKWYQ